MSSPHSDKASGKINSSKQAVRDFFCCPEGIFNYHLASELSDKAGYFQFGPNLTCYGRSKSGAQSTYPASHLPDLLPEVKADSSRLMLPFDPEEVISNLRLERYPSTQIEKYEKLLKSVYYQLRPFSNLFLRRSIQKFRALSWKKRQFPAWPVDTTVENLCETLLVISMQANGADSVPFIWFWPRGARGCVTMTHDVETPAGRDFCAQLLDLNDSYGIKASFHIVPEERYQVTPEFLNSIRSRGSEICVQDLNHDGRLFDNRQEFLRRVQSINRYGREYKAKGFRSAILYRNLDWYNELEFEYDMSVPNVAHLDPQRGGCCTVMPYFIGDILELPLTTAQDYTLFHVLNEHSIALWKLQIEKILAKNGLMTFLIHPDYIIKPEPCALYEELLATLNQLGKQEALWFALPSEINQWWRARAQMSIVPDGSSWKIVGEGSEDAVLAFARLRNGQIFYEVNAANDGRLLSRDAQREGFPA